LQKDCFLSTSKKVEAAKSKQKEQSNMVRQLHRHRNSYIPALGHTESEEQKPRIKNHLKTELSCKEYDLELEREGEEARYSLQLPSLMSPSALKPIKNGNTLH